MARAKKAKTVEVIKKNPGVFTEDEATSYRKTLIQELEGKTKGSVSRDEIHALADSVIGKNEETTLWLRKKGMLFVSTYLLDVRNQAIQSEGKLAS